MNETALGQLLVMRGLVSAEQLHALLGRRRAGDPRGLAELLRDSGLVAPGDLQRLLAGTAPGLSHPGFSSPGFSSPGWPARPLPDTGPDPGLASGSHSGRRLRASGRFAPPREGEVLPLRPELDVRVERLLGEGGMGSVFLVRDGSLSRMAALKLMKPGGSPVRAVRFRREAAVTARLDHPGIPPVFATGLTPGGQDYLLMRYVAGKSLAELLGWGRHDTGSTAMDEAPDERRLLDALVKVGEALAYAHYRGIVHRDVKPANIMIGAYGEVLLMDWGLARDLSETSQEDEQVRQELQAALESTTRRNMNLTQEGAVLGTPGYMSPEQARGDDVDARADVFALGSILTEVLTGDPAVTGATVLEVIGKTSAGQVEPPSSRSPRVPPELDAIATRALAPLEQRYATAERFAADLKAWLEGRPVSVYRYTRREQARRLVRRHPAAVAGAVAVAAVATLGLVAVGRARGVERAAAVDRDREAAQAAWTALEAAREAPAETRLGLALAALQGAQRWRLQAPEERPAAAAEFQAAMALGQVSQEAEQWALAAQAFAQAAALGVDDARAQAAAVRVEEARTGERRRRREAVLELIQRVSSGGFQDKGGAFQEAVFQLVGHSSPDTLALLIEHLDRISAELGRVQRAVLLEAGSPDRDEVRVGERPIEGLASALVEREGAGLSGQPSEQAQAALRAAEERILRRLARVKGGARTVLQHVARRQRETLGTGQLLLARLICEALGRLGQLDQAAAQDALARYLASEADGLRAVAAGLALCRLGGERAQRLYLDARERFHDEHFRDTVDQSFAQLLGDEELTLEAPTARGHLRRGQARLARGRHAEAIPDLTRALELDPRLARAWADRGIARAAQGDLRGAIEDHSRAIELEPGRAGYWANRSGARAGLRDLSGAQKDMDRAIELDPGDSRLYANRALMRAEHLQDQEGALQDLTRALELDPTNVAAWLGRAQLRTRRGELTAAREDADRAVALTPDDGRVWLVRGLIREDLGDPVGALEDFNRAAELSPREPAVRNNRGNVYLNQGDGRAAVADFERAIELDPKNEMFWRNLARGHLACGAPDKALEAVGRALELAPRVGHSWQVRAQALLRLRDEPGALAALDQAVELSPRHAAIRRDRARLRVQKGDLAGAQVDLQVLEELAPTDVMTHALRADLLQRTGDRGAALEAVERQLLERPDDPYLLDQRGQLFGLMGDYPSAERDFTRAIELGLKQPLAFVNRGGTRLRSGRPRDALADYEQALALDPRFGRAWLGLSGVRLLLDDLRGAEEAATRALELDPTEVGAWVNRALARLRLGSPAGAVEDATRAAELDPQDSEPLGVRAQARLEARDPGGALRDVDQALALSPDEPPLLLVRAKALLALGRKEEAAGDLQRYLQRGGEDQDGQVRRQLEKLRR